MIEPKLVIRCPCCNAEIELQARPVQAELPLGPIELTPAKQKKLDASQPDLGTIERFDSITISDSKSLIERDSVNDSNRFGEKATQVPEIESESESLNRIASSEEDLIESIRAIVGEIEWSLNGGGWRWRAKNYSKAVCFAIEDFKMQTPGRRSTIQNRAAWLTDRFKRAQSQLQREAKVRKRA